jgi:hypothetical protein
LNGVIQKIGLTTADSHQLTQRERKERDDHTREILHKIFEDLKSINEQRSSKLVLVFLPLMGDLGGDGPREWTKFLEEESKSLGIPCINLFAEFRFLPYHEVVRLFIPKNQMGADHLTDTGNELVAKVIHDKLMNDPALSRVLSARIH